MNDSDMLESRLPQLRITVVGVGGAGNNATDRLKLDHLACVDLLNINTDQKTLSASPVSEKLMIGRAVTRGLSAGGEVSIGRQAAEADREQITQAVTGSDLVFLLVGLGGGTGSGAAPLVAECAKESGAIVITFATLPFTREGTRRMAQAEDALQLLREACHAVITLPNDVLLQEITDDATLLEAFSLADDWIQRGVRGLWSMLFQNGLINVDFATLRQALAIQGGKTLFGLGSGSGEARVARALQSLEMCPLLHLPENRYVRSLDSLIVNIIGGPSLTMQEVNEVMDFVTDRFGSKDHTIFGAVIDETLSEEIGITVIGTTAVEGSFRRYRAPATVNGTGHAKKTVASVDRVAVPRSTTTGEARVEGAVATTPVSAAARSRASAAQNEFDFPSVEESRGHFEKTDHNLYEGADLDVPTYLRRGVKISLS